MDELHNILDTFFFHLENTGSVSNSELMKLVTVSLIDDYGIDMISCNRSYERILNDILSSFTGSSCMFNVNSWNQRPYSMKHGSIGSFVPHGYVVETDTEIFDAESITKIDIDNMMK